MTHPTQTQTSDFMERYFRHLRDGRKEYTEAEVRSIMLAFDMELRRVNAERDQLRARVAQLEAERVQLGEPIRLCDCGGGQWVEAVESTDYVEFYRAPLTKGEN